MDCLEEVLLYLRDSLLDRAVLADEVEKLLARFGGFEDAAEVARGGDGILLFHTAHLHTHVFGFNDYHYALRIEGFLNTVLDLHSHSFLHL